MAMSDILKWVVNSEEFKKGGKALRGSLGDLFTKEDGLGDSARQAKSALGSTGLLGSMPSVVSEAEAAVPPQPERPEALEPQTELASISKPQEEQQQAPTLGNISKPDSRLDQYASQLFAPKPVKSKWQKIAESFGTAGTTMQEMGGDRGALDRLRSQRAKEDQAGGMDVEKMKVLQMLEARNRPSAQAKIPRDYMAETAMKAEIAGVPKAETLEEGAPWYTLGMGEPEVSPEDAQGERSRMIRDIVAQYRGGQPQQLDSSRTIQMRNAAGKIFNIPANQVQEARIDGLTEV